jgi:hypothetical protein
MVERRSDELDNGEQAREQNPLSIIADRVKNLFLERPLIVTPEQTDIYDIHAATNDALRETEAEKSPFLIFGEIIPHTTLSPYELIEEIGTETDGTWETWVRDVNARVVWEQVNSDPIISREDLKRSNVRDAL